MLYSIDTQLRKFVGDWNMGMGVLGIGSQLERMAMMKMTCMRSIYAHVGVVSVMTKSKISWCLRLGSRLRVQ
jgi:hypothetical protein